MRAQINIEAVVDAENDEVKDAVQVFVDTLNDDLSGEDIVAKITVLEDSEIEVTPSSW